MVADCSVTATQVKSVDLTEKVTVLELHGHLELTPQYCRDTQRLALEAQRDTAA